MTASKRAEEYATTQLNITTAQERLAASQAECAFLRTQLAGAQAAALSNTGHTPWLPQHPHAASESAVASAASADMSEMRKMVEAARKEREAEKAAARQRDVDMARQLSDIRAQALARIKEATTAAAEVRRRCHVSSPSFSFSFSLLFLSLVR